MRMRGNSEARNSNLDMNVGYKQLAVCIQYTAVFIQYTTACVQYATVYYSMLQ